MGGDLAVRRLRDGGDPPPKLILAVADLAEYGPGGEDGEPARRMPWQLERALLCRQFDWRWTPGELEEIDPAELKAARDLLGVWDAMRQRGASIKGMTADQVELAGRVDRLRDAAKQARAGS